MPESIEFHANYDETIGLAALAIHTHSYTVPTNRTIGNFVASAAFAALGRATLRINGVTIARKFLCTTNPNIDFVGLNGQQFPAGTVIQISVVNQDASAADVHTTIAYELM